MHEYIILAINLGSTSSKVSAFRNEEVIFQESVNHDSKALENFSNVWEQYEYRKNAILSVLAQRKLALDSIDIFASRGGNIKPVPGGIYTINQAMLEDMRSGKYGLHPCNVGCLIVHDISKECGKPGILIDPPVTDELCAEARHTGVSEITRQSSFHALNQKATARKLGADLGKKYEDINVIVCHLGGGISVGAHRKGKVIDVNNALDGDGPMAPERAGAVPTGSLCDLCYSGKFTHAEMRKKLTGRGGWVAHVGTNDGRELLKRVKEGDEKALAIFKATCYQVAKNVGAMAVALEGKVDAIALTGSLAYAPEIVEELKRLTAFIAPIYIYPGENEMDALGAGSLRYLRGEEEAKLY